MGEYRAKIEIEVVMTPQIAAAAFCSWSDEQQADFFIECAKIAEVNMRGDGRMGPWFQWDSIGGHLKTCSCSTPEAREMVESIYLGMTRENAHA